MSKYKPLADFLGGHVPDSWKVGFDELETTLGFSLPKTAREKSSWWSNDAASPGPHAKAWLESGWLAEAVDMAAGHVTFRRGAPAIDPAPDPTAHQVMSAAEAAFEKDRVVDTAKKVGVAAAVVGVLAGIGLMVRTALGRRS